MGQMLASTAAGMAIGDKMGGMVKSTDKSMGRDHDMMYRQAMQAPAK